MAVVTPTDRPKSYLSRCEIEVFRGVCVVALSYGLSVGKEDFVVEMSHISSFIPFVKSIFHLNCDAMKCQTLPVSLYIYTSSVFCYNKHKKNFDIHFSMKRHETV